VRGRVSDVGMASQFGAWTHPPDAWHRWLRRQCLGQFEESGSSLLRAAANRSTSDIPNSRRASSASCLRPSAS
jgi:hypothetical protein